MLINLSNHPSSLWPAIQMESAVRAFGSVLDIPFPPVDPTVGSDNIKALALQFAELCFKQFDNLTIEQLNNAVHVMGELTFSFALVGLLQKKGIRCIASTTERLVTQNGNSKLSEFAFVRFRDYAVISEL